MSAVCRWVPDKELGRFFVPGCMGAAVYGEHACTCDRRKNTTADRLQRLENQVEELTAKFGRLEKRHV